MNVHLLNIISCIIRVIAFIKSSKIHQNVEGLFGLAAIEGVVEHILAIEGIPHSIKKIALKVQKESRLTLNESIAFVQESDLVNYERTGFLLESPWKPVVRYQKLLSPGLHWAVDSKIQSAFTEGQSDKCFQAAYRNRDTCSFDSNCLNLMVVIDYARGYFLTHQVLYATLIESFGCSYVTTPSGVKIDVRLRLAHLCSKVYAEHQQHKLALLDGIGPLRHSVRLTFDLLLEQVFACGRIGFAQFAADSRLFDALQSAQRTDLGCFGVPPAPPNTLLPQRSLLAVRRLKGGCELHLTSVAACAASVYLMLHLDPDPAAQELMVSAEPSHQSLPSVAAVGIGLVWCCCFCFSVLRRRLIRCAIRVVLARHDGLCQP